MVKGYEIIKKEKMIVRKNIRDIIFFVKKEMS